FQGHTGVLRQAGTAHHFGSGLLHGDHRLVGVGLNGLNQGLDLLGRRGGTFREALYLVRYHGEAAAGVTGHRRLDRGVKGEDVGLVGNVVDQANDVTDLLGRFTEALDPLRGVLNLLTDVVHAGDGVVYDLVALVGDGYGTFRYRGGFRGVGRYLVNRHGHFVDRSRGAGDFLGLVLGSLGQVHRGSLGFLGGGGHLHGGLVDRRYQVAQLVDGVVDGVGDGTGEVFGYCRGHGQVTVGEVGDLVEQSQNRRLVTFVLLGGFSQTMVGFTHHHQADEDDRAQRQGAQHVTEQGIERTAGSQIIETGGQIGRFVQQGLRHGKDGVRRLTNLEQFRRGFENLVHRTGHEFEQFGNLGQTLEGLLVGHLGDFHRRVAFQHRRQYTTEQAGITAEHVGSLYRVFVTGQNLVHRTENTFGQQRLTLSHGYLGSRCTAFQQDVDYFLVLDLQLRNGFRQGGGYLVQRQYGLFAGQNGVSVLPQAVPVLLYRSHLCLYRLRCRWQAAAGVAIGQVAPALLEVVARIAQQPEGFGSTGRRFSGVLGDTLGQYAQLTGVTDVLGI